MAARQTPPGESQNRNDVDAQAPGPSGPVIRVGCLTRRVTGVRDEWPSRSRLDPRALQNPAYRLADTCKGARRKNRRAPTNFGTQFFMALARAGHDVRACAELAERTYLLRTRTSSRQT